MQDTQVLVTRKQTVRAVCYLLFGLVVCYASFSFLTARYKDQGPDSFMEVIGGLLGLYGFHVFYIIYSRFDSLVLYEDRLEVFSILGYRKRTIQLSSISSWGEYTGKGFSIFILFTDADK